MWESIEHLLLSPNANLILVFILVIVILAIILSRRGLLNVHTENIEIGATDREHAIMRQQMEWVTLHCEAVMTSIQKPDGYDHWRGMYIAEKVLDEYFEMILFNHITTSEAYIELKQGRIVNIVHKHTVIDYFQSEEFDNMIKADTKETIEMLVQIRKLYKK